MSLQHSEMFFYSLDIPVEFSDDDDSNKNIVAEVGDTVKFQCIASSPVKLFMTWSPPCTVSIQPGKGMRSTKMKNMI